MTREEAIRELKEDIELYIPLRGTIDDVDRDLPDGRLITALEMAIKALEQEPCEDAISRQAVLEQINYWAIGNREYLPTNAMHYLTRRIQDMPPVNPQPKTGDEWVDDVVESMKGETWNGIHAQITAPKGTFERIFNDADDENDI